MKKPVLVLLALLSLIPLAQSMAQTTPGAAPPANFVTAPVPDAATAHFLATLSGGQSQTLKDLAPAPSFRTGCSSDDQCPAGQVCCALCGNVPMDGGCPTTCFTGKRCPLVE
jgi:hypothetical protein